MKVAKFGQDLSNYTENIKGYAEHSDTIVWEFKNPSGIIDLAEKELFEYY